MVGMGRGEPPDGKPLDDHFSYMANSPDGKP